MSSDFIQQAMRVFLGAVDLPASEQGAWIARECAGNDILRDRVLELMRHAEEQGACDPIAPSARLGPTAAAGVELGDFVLHEELGRGGMGVVWQARQQSLQRDVALKLVPPAMATPELLRRLEREAAILGRLQHPGIASVYAVGSAALGGSEQHFFAMELVRGEPLDDYVKASDLDLDARLQLIALICDAVEHAHQQGVVHRDLKPDNILVMAGGQPKVLDFGIARATSSDVMAMTMQTAVGQVIGTVPYMSPEQVLGDSSQIDARSDVYALGALLYQLLSGRLPADVRDRSIPEAARIIRDEDPTRLATIVTTCRGDVDTIVHKALEKERERRYQTAGAMAADIRRYLAHEPIVARPTTTLYQARKFARRHKGLVGGLLATMVVLVVGVVVAVLLAVDATRNAAAFERAAYSQSLMVASAALADHDVATAERALQSSPERLRGWEWRHLHSRLDMNLWALDLPPTVDAPASDPWFSSDNGTVSMWLTHRSTQVQALEQWDLRTGTRLAPQHAFQRHSGVRSVWRQVGCGYRDTESVHLFVPESSAGDGALRERVVPIVPGSLLASNDPLHYGHYVVAEDASMLAVAMRDSRRWGFTAFVMDLDGSNQRKIGPGNILGIRADGRRVAVYQERARSLNGDFRILDLETDRSTSFSGHSGELSGFAATRDWRWVATGSEDSTVRLWNGDTGEALARSAPTREKIANVAMSEATSRLASISEGGQLRVWRLPDLEPTCVLHGHRSRLYPAKLSFSTDGSLLASCGGEARKLRIWDTRADEQVWSLPHDSYVYGLAVSPDGNRIASGGWDRKVRIWDASTLEQIAELEDDAMSLVFSVGFSPDGRSVAVIDQDYGLHLWDVDGEPTLRKTVSDYGLEISAPPTWHRDGERLVVAIEDTTVRMLDRRSGHESSEPIAILRECRGGLVSPDGSRFVRGVRYWDADNGASHHIALFDTETGRELARAYTDMNGLKFAFSPAGSGPLRLLAPLLRGEGSERQHGFCLFDAVTGEKLAERLVGQAAMLAVAFSPDAKRIVTGGYDRSIRVWDAEQLDELVQLQGHGYYVYRMAFAPDGQRLYSAGGDGTVRVWGTAPLRELLLARREK